MSVQTRTKDVKGSVFSWRQTNSNAPVYFYGWSGWDYKSQTGEFRSKPKGFKTPTAYSMEAKYGAWNACANSYCQSRNTFNLVRRYSGGVNSFNSQWSNVPGGVGSFDPNVTNKAILDARKRIKNQKVNLAVAFAERRQTSNLVASTAKRVAQAIDACRRHDPKGIKRALGIVSRDRPTRRERAILRNFGRGPKDPVSREKAAAQLWLANAYGVKPLLSDVKGSAEALAEADRKDPQRYRLHVKGFSTSTDKYTSKVPAYVDYQGTLLGELTFSVVKTSRAMCRIDAFLENPGLAQAASLGLTNPAEVLWEKTPWSFVVDWFIPIGQYLGTMDATLGWSFKSGSTSKRYEMKASVSAGAPSSNPGYDQIVISGTGKFGLVTLQRSADAAFPFPARILPKNPISASHVSNAIALLISKR